MFIESDMRERHGRVLAELAEVGMVMVRRLGEAMLQVADIQVQAQIGLAFHRVSRAVRQTMALEFRLAQAAHRDAVALQPPLPARASASAPPRPTAERVGWNEYERADSDEPLDALDELLEAEDLDAETVHEAVETTMARLRRDLGSDNVFFSPEFLREGRALNDNLYPSRIIVGEPGPRGRQFADLMLEGAAGREILSLAEALA
jgi:hypothetical protein